MTFKTRKSRSCILQIDFLLLRIAADPAASFFKSRCYASFNI